MIEAAQAQNGGDPERGEAILVDMLSERSIADMYSFGLLYRKYAWFAYREDLWSAAAIIASGCSDDGFSDFRGWLIGRGEKIYYQALQDPESLADVVDAICEQGWIWGNVFTGSVEFAYDLAYEKRFGEDMPFAPHNPDIPRLIGPIWDEETRKRMYPRLTAKFDIGECDDEAK